MSDVTSKTGKRSTGKKSSSTTTVLSSPSIRDVDTDCHTRYSMISGRDDGLNLKGRKLTKLQPIEATTNPDLPSEKVNSDPDNWRIEYENELRLTEMLQSYHSNLKSRYDEFQQNVKLSKDNPTSDVDMEIRNQVQFNETLTKQINDSRKKLTDLTKQLKLEQTKTFCRNDCHLHMHDLCLNYHCITKNELSREIRRFQRMQIDLKSNLDRLQWRIDSEAKIHHSLADEYHKLKMDLMFLKSNEKGSCAG